MIFVLAGTAAEAEDWRITQGLSRRQARFLWAGKQLLGFTRDEVDVVLIGTWRERPDLVEITDRLHGMRVP